MLARTAVQVGVLVALATIFAFAHVANEPLRGDPAMYGTIAKTIVATGEWHRLTFNGEPYFNKPPLHFWLNALVFHVLPPTTLTASLLPSLLGVIDALLLYALCRRTLAGGQEAFLAAIVFITTPEVVHWGRGVHLETLLTLWVLLGLWAAYRSVARPSAVLLLGIAIVGGWLAKGPQALFPLAVAPWLWVRAGVSGARLRSGWTLAAASVCIVAIGSWVALRAAEVGFVSAYFGGQVGRVLLGGGWFDRGPLWYVVKLLRTYWPWLPCAAAGLVILGRRARTSLGSSLWIVFTAVVMLAISVAGVKKSRYLFQVYPALAAASGVALAVLASRMPRLPAIVTAGASIGAVVMLIVGGGVTEPRPHVRDALATARLLPTETTVLLSHEAQHGHPAVSKILGFHGGALLRTCRANCVDEASPRAKIVTRRWEADQVAAAVAGVVVHRNDTLAIVEAYTAAPTGATDLAVTARTCRAAR